MLQVDLEREGPPIGHDVCDSDAMRTMKMTTQLVYFGVD